MPDRHATMHDPKWRRFQAEGAQPAVHETHPGAVAAIAVGGFQCTDCGDVNVTFAIVSPEGDEMNCRVHPDVAVDVCKAIVEVLADVGQIYLALQGMRALSMVSELATMTEPECDFLDAHGLREACRLIVGGKVATMPRLYTEEDEKRARAALTDRFYAGNVVSMVSAKPSEIVTIVAEALGMRKAGA